MVAICFPRFWRLEVQLRALGNIHFLTDGGFLLCLHVVRGSFLISWLLVAALILFLRVPPSEPNYLLKTPPPNSICQLED